MYHNCIIVGEVLEKGETRNNIPTDFGLNYKNGPFKASLFEQYVGTSYDEDLHVNANAAKIDAFMLTNLKFTFEPQKSDYIYSFAINNLFDEDYEYYLYEPMPGRSYTFSVRKKF